VTAVAMINRLLSVVLILNPVQRRERSCSVAVR
jgi:hypothetical protein